MSEDRYGAHGQVGSVSAPEDAMDSMPLFKGWLSTGKTI